MMTLLSLIIDGYRKEHISSRLVTKAGTSLMEKTAPDVFQCDASQLTFGRFDELPINATLFDRCIMKIRPYILDSKIKRGSRVKYETTVFANAELSQHGKLLDMVEAEEGY